jgi:hypothetical protein
MNDPLRRACSFDPFVTQIANGGRLTAEALVGAAGRSMTVSAPLDGPLRGMKFEQADVGHA